MRLMRIFLSVCGLLIVIIVLAMLSLVMFVNPNKLKPVITEAVVKKTGYQLAIDGDLTWSFYPHLSVKIERMLLTAPKQVKPFLDLHDVKIATSLSQIWRGKEKFNGNIAIANVRLMNMAMQNVSTDLHWQDNVLTLQPIKAALYGGSLTGVAHGYNLAVMPHWNWDIKFNQVQMQSLLQDMNGPDTKLRLSGTGQGKIQGEVEGKNKEQIISHLNGKCELNLQQGIFEGINLNYFVQAADALINKQALPPPNNLNQTQFDRFATSISIREGVATTQQLSLISPGFTTSGNGSLELATQVIRLQLQVKPQRNTTNQTNKEWEVPVLITGTLQQPDVRLDMDKIHQLITSQEIDKAKTKAREIIQEHVPGKAGEFLQNLLRK